MRQILAFRKHHVNRIAYINFLAFGYKPQMDIDEIRRVNLRALESKLGPAIYKAAGMSPTQFYNLREGAKDSKTGKKRGMRKETAWKLEDAAGVPRGYLDIAHGEDAAGLMAATCAEVRPIPATNLAIAAVVHRLADWIKLVDPGQRLALGESLRQLAVAPDQPQGCIAILEALTGIHETDEDKARAPKL
jgi:hypothetical protein